MNTNYAEAREEYGDTVVDEALHIARINAKIWQDQHSYIPEDISNFYPHDWVMSAICYLLSEIE